MKNLKNLSIKELITPTLILAVICFVVTFALVTTYKITAPIISIAAEKQAEEARKLVLPEGEGFKLILSSIYVNRN